MITAFNFSSDEISSAQIKSTGVKFPLRVEAESHSHQTFWVSLTTLLVQDVLAQALATKCNLCLETSIVVVSVFFTSINFILCLQTF